MHPEQAEPVSAVVVTPGADGTARVTDLRNPEREEYAAPYPETPPPPPEPPPPLPPLPPPTVTRTAISPDGLVARLSGTLPEGAERLRWQIAVTPEADPEDPAHWRDLTDEIGPTLTVTAAFVEASAPHWDEGVTFPRDGDSSFTGTVHEVRMRLLAARAVTPPAANGDAAAPVTDSDAWSASEPVTLRRVRGLG